MLAGFRQAIGFGSYVIFLEEFNKIFVGSSYKYMGYTASAMCAKTMAVTICSPIMILKTRLELLTNQNLSIKLTTIQII